MSTSPTPLELSPIVAGRYSIRGKLGAGGLGVVYLAWDPVEQRRVALKVLRGERLLADPVGRMQREFRAVASLRHPRIAAAYDFGYLDSSHVPYYTREYIAGEPLSSGPPLAVSPEASLRPTPPPRLRQDRRAWASYAK